MTAGTLADTIAEAMAQDREQAINPTGEEHPPLADRIADAIHARYHMIPVTETEDVRAEYMIPDDLAADLPAAQAYHRQQLAHLVAASAMNGFLIISRARCTELPILPGTPPGMARFKLTALGWRPTDETPTQETPTL